MKVYFLRHGEADWPDWDKPDDDRPLTKKGCKEMERVAKFLAALEPNVSLILSSPLPRALQTAEIAAKNLRVEIQPEPDIAHGFNLEKLRAILARENRTNLMLVGHEPTFSEVIYGLTGGTVKLSKAGIALVELDRPDGKGRLLWLIPPKIAKLAPHDREAAPNE